MFGEVVVFEYVCYGVLFGQVDYVGCVYFVELF